MHAGTADANWRKINLASEWGTAMTGYLKLKSSENIKVQYRHNLVYKFNSLSKNS